MTKAVTIRLADDAYKLLAEKAKAERRSLANLIEFGALSYVQGSTRPVDDVEEKRSKALKKLFGLWKDHPVQNPDVYIRKLRKGGRLKRLGLK